MRKCASAARATMCHIKFWHIYDNVEKKFFWHELQVSISQKGGPLRGFTLFSLHGDKWITPPASQVRCVLVPTLPAPAWPLQQPTGTTGLCRSTSVHSDVASWSFNVGFPVIVNRIHQVLAVSSANSEHYI